MFDQKFLNSIPDDEMEGILFLTRSYIDGRKYKASNLKWQHEFLSLFEAFLKKNNVEFKPLVLEYELGKDAPKIYRFFKRFHWVYSEKKEKNELKRIRGKYDESIIESYIIELDDNEFDRIQKLVNEIRDLIRKSKAITDQKFKQRLLRRLERFQGELHKRISDFDRYAGLFVDAGITFGKFGESVKPIVDRIKEIVEIGGKALSRAEDLPSGISILPLNKGQE